METCSVCTSGKEVFRCNTADFCCLWTPSPALQTALCHREGCICTSMRHEDSLSPCLLLCIITRKIFLKKYLFNVRTAVAIIRHPEKFVPRYGEVATHTTWKALWVWRCPARCYNSFLGSWSWSFQLIPHHTICLYQWRLWGLLLCSCNSTASHLSHTLLIHALRVRSMHILYFCFSPQIE